MNNEFTEASPAIGSISSDFSFLNGVSNSLLQLLFNLILILVTLGTTGCSTLSSLGLPFTSSTNRILKSAKDISEAPGQALLMPNELSKQPLDTYLVEIGDSIFIEPVSFDATIRLPGDQTVRPDGTVSIGEFGDYQAAQKTISQIELEIQSLIDTHIRNDLESEYLEERQREQQTDSELDIPRPEFEDSSDSDEDVSSEESERRMQLERRISERIKQNEISVRLVNWDSKKIYVLGEVNSPGFFPFTGNQTVLDAIIEAGGLSANANHHQVIVSRPTKCGSCRIVMKVCYDQIVQLGDTSTNYQIQPGDRVFVPAVTFLEDLKNTLSCNKDPQCPRCAPCQEGCGLATGCQ